MIPVTVAAYAATPAPSPAPAEDDYRRLVRLGSPAIAPDGKTVAIVVSRALWDDDRYEPDLVLVDTARHTVRTLVHAGKGLSDPAFSPDGTSLGYIAEAGTGDDARAQVFVLPLDGNAARQVTHSKTGVDRFAWRPDGRALVYAATDPQPERAGAARSAASSFVSFH